MWGREGVEFSPDCPVQYGTAPGWSLPVKFTTIVQGQWLPTDTLDRLARRGRCWSWRRRSRRSEWEERGARSGKEGYFRGRGAPLCNPGVAQG